jgi:pimeloyl-ACP methyl ester carboxylesterase
MDHLKIKKAHIVGYSLGGMITVKFMAKHPTRVLSGTVAGMGWLKEGSPLQKFWEGTGKGKDIKFGPPPVMLESITQLAVTEKELKKIDVPVKILIGDKDICKQLYVEPLQKVRKDWPVVEIKDADHLSCLLRPQFKEEIAAWVRKNSK